MARPLHSTAAEMFRDYVLIVDPDASARRELVLELGHAYPLLVTSDAEGACGRVRRWGPPHAVVSSVDIESMFEGLRLLQTLALHCPGTLVIRLVKEAAPGAPHAGFRAISARRIAWVDPSGDVAFEIEHGEVELMPPPASEHLAVIPELVR